MNGEETVPSPLEEKRVTRSSCVVLDIPLNTLSFNFSSTSQKRKMYPSKDKTGSFQVHRSGSVVSYACAQTFNCPRPTYLPTSKEAWVCHAGVTVPTFIGGLPGGSGGKESACNVGHLGSIPGLGRSPGEGNGNLLQYSGLENSTDKEPGRLQSIALQRAQHNWATNTFTFIGIIKSYRDLIRVPLLI